MTNPVPKLERIEGSYDYKDWDTMDSFHRARPAGVAVKPSSSSTYLGEKDLEKTILNGMR